MLNSLVVAMTAATAAFMVMLMLVATALAVVASATVVAHVVQHVLNLLVGGLTVFQHDACKLQGTASQRVVGVDGHAVLVNFQDTGHEAMLLLVHQGDDGSLVDVLVVEVAVDGEVLAQHLVHTILFVLAEGIGRSQREVELVASLQGSDALLEAVERKAEAADERKGFALLGLLFQLLAAVGIDRVELIAHGDVLVLFVVHK